MESDNKLFLLDAYALIYRAYYAFIKNPRINSKGFNTSAILGFVNTLEEVLKKENPSHIGVAFDPSGPTFRHEAFEQYKAHRNSSHRSRTSGHHHLYDDSRQRLRPAGDEQRIHVSPQTYGRF